MSMKSSAEKVGNLLSRPFHREGTPTRLHPASLWRETGTVAKIYVAPVWSKVMVWCRRYIAPGLATISTLGFVVLGAALVLWILGAAFGWQEAKVAGLLAVVLLLIAIAFILGKSMYAVKLDLARTRVAVGDNAVGSIAVANTSARTMLPAALELPVGQATALFHPPRRHHRGPRAFCARGPPALAAPPAAVDRSHRSLCAPPHHLP